MQCKFVHINYVSVHGSYVSLPQLNLVGWLVGWSVSRSVSQSVGRSVGRSVGWSVGFVLFLLQWVSGYIVR